MQGGQAINNDSRGLSHKSRPVKMNINTKISIKVSHDYLHYVQTLKQCPYKSHLSRFTTLRQVTEETSAASQLHSNTIEPAGSSTVPGTLHCQG